MERMGHSSTRVALIYLHATAERQRPLADTLGTLIEAERAPDQGAYGEDVARRTQDNAGTKKPKSVDLG